MAGEKIKVVLLGTHHPHFYIRTQILQQRGDIEFLGFWEEDQVLAEKVEKRTEIKRYHSEHDLIKQSFDLAFVHSLDYDVPRLARLAAERNPKGLFLEKPGASRPEYLFSLAEDLAKKPEIEIEFGWEMHYAEVMDVVRDLVKNQTLGQITTSHWHGGTPSGAGDELWQRLDGNLGGFVYEDACHTLEAIINVFGRPKSVSASIRKLPPGETHPIVSCWYDMHKEELDPSKTEMTIGTLRYEDVGSVILEYETHNVIADFTAWEPTDWCEDWGINIYGTNGTFHGVLNPPIGEVKLRSAKGGYAKGVSQLTTEKPPGVSNQFGYYTRQLDSFLQRAIHGLANTEKSGMNIEIDLMKTLDAMFQSARERRFVDLV